MMLAIRCEVSLMMQSELITVVLLAAVGLPTTAMMMHPRRVSQTLGADQRDVLVVDGLPCRGGELFERVS